jgi:hypothetical protein
MYSLLRKGLVYKDISPDIVEHDNDIDADQWEYDGKDVYRGRFDPTYTEYNLNVYWLYDDNLNRIGLAEHEADEPQIYKALWFYDNPFATLYQDESWKSKNSTLWSLLSNEAYQDCLEDDFKTIFDRCLSSKYRLVTPEMIVNPPIIYECKKCGKQSLKKLSCSNVIEKVYLDFQNLLYIDDSFIIYDKSTAQHVASEQEQQEPQIELADQVLQDAQKAVPPHLPEQVAQPLE